jgi:hypothetical protein
MRREINYDAILPKPTPSTKVPTLIVNLRQAIQKYRDIVQEKDIAVDGLLKTPMRSLSNWQLQEILIHLKQNFLHVSTVEAVLKDLSELAILQMNKEQLTNTYMKCVTNHSEDENFRKHKEHAEYETDKKKWKFHIAEKRKISSLVSIVFGVFVQVILLLPTLSFFELPLYGSIPLVVIADVVSFIAFHFEHIDARFHCFIKDKDHEDHTIFNWKRFPETFPSTSRMSLLLYIVSIALNISSLIVENNILLLFALGFSLLTRLSTDIIDVLFLK